MTSENAMNEAEWLAWLSGTVNGALIADVDEPTIPHCTTAETYTRLLQIIEDRELRISMATSCLTAWHTEEGVEVKDSTLAALQGEVGYFFISLHVRLMDNLALLDNEANVLEDQVRKLRENAQSVDQVLFERRGEQLNAALDEVQQYRNERDLANKRCEDLTVAFNRLAAISERQLSDRNRAKAQVEQVEHGLAVQPEMPQNHD